MGSHHQSTNVHETEVHNKDITQRNNNVENENNHYVEHNKEHNVLNGDKAYGGGVASNGDSNYGHAVYKLVNLDGQNIQLQNLMQEPFMQLPLGYQGVQKGARIAGAVGGMGFMNLDQQELQNLGFMGDLTGAIGGAADLTGAVWSAVDEKDYDKHGKGIVGGISTGAKGVGAMDKQYGIGKKTGMDDFMGDMGFMNLDQQELQNLDFMGDMGFMNLDEQELQNLGLLGGVTGAVGGAADLTGAVWGAADMRPQKHGKGIVGGISKGAGIAGDIGFINLEQQGLQNLNGASHAIIATPEQAVELLNMNNQLENPYQVKGAYLI